MSTKTSKKRNPQAGTPPDIFADVGGNAKRIGKARRKLDAAMDAFHASKHTLDEAILRYIESFTEPVKRKQAGT